MRKRAMPRVRPVRVGSLAICLIVSAAIVAHAQTQPPVIVSPAGITAPYCDLLQYNFDLTNPSGCAGATFTLLSGPGAIDPLTGLWSYQPTIADVGRALSIQVVARCANGSSTPVTTVPLTVTNQAPVFTNCPTTSLTADAGYVRTVDLDAADHCPDSLRYRLLSDGGIDGLVSIGSVNGMLMLTASNSDFGRVDIVVAINDGLAEDTCAVRFFVVPTACQGGETGDIDGDGSVDLSDLMDLVNFLFFGQNLHRSAVFANINGDPACRVDLSDVIYLATFLIHGGPAPTDCLQPCEHVGKLSTDEPAAPANEDLEGRGFEE
jgi:hypothetical protein